MYDITKKDTFEVIPKWLKEIREQGESGMPILICGNKIDLAHIREVSEKEGRDFATKNKVLFAETSACEGLGVDEAFMSVVDELFKTTKTTKSTPMDQKVTVQVSVDGGKKAETGGCQC